MSKISAIKNTTKKTNPSKNGDKSNELEKTKLMQKEQTKNNDMFLDKNIQNLNSNIQKEVSNYLKNLNSLFTNLQSSTKNLQQTKDTGALRVAASTLSSVALQFFSSTDELIKTIKSIYEEDNGLLSDKEKKRLENLVKSLSISLSMSLAFYKSSKKMISKLDLESDLYEEFESSLFSFLDITKTIQTRISSNLSAFKSEQIKVNLNDESSISFFANEAKALSDIESKYKAFSMELYNNIKDVSSLIRDEKRQNDEKRNKKVVKVNI